jgi:ubiquinone/menaquinone biosynthesis C-methylase UbiE
MPDDGQFWSQSSDRYADLIAEADVIRQIVYPSLVRNLGVSGPILDFGGGPGLLFGTLPGDREVALYDPSESAVAIARRNCPSEWLRRRYFWSSLSDLPTNHFEAVLMCFVLMAISTRDEELSVLRAARISMRQGGQLNVVITHPCFRAYRFSCFETEFSRGRFFDYFAQDVPFMVFLRGRDPTNEIALPNFHRSLDVTLENIQLSGFEIGTVSEIPDYDHGRWFNNLVPPYLLIRATASDRGR